MISRTTAPETINSPETQSSLTRPSVTDPAGLRRIHERMLAPNFPVGELISVDELTRRVSSGRSTVRVVGDQDDPTAVAVIDSFPASPAVLLSYFATRADQRGRGVGSALLREILDDVRSDPTVSLVFAEVEHPHHHDGSDAHGDPTARMRFYGRLGARIIDVPYFLTPNAPSTAAVYGMLLLALDPAPAVIDDERLTPQAGLGAALEAMMADADPELHPVEATLDAANDPLGPRLLPTGDISEAQVALQSQAA